MAATSSGNKKARNNRAGRKNSPVSTRGASGKIIDPTPAPVASKGPDFVTAVTNSDAFQQAKAAGAAHDKLLDEQGDKAESVGRTAIYEALRFAERFRDQNGTIDLSALKDFLSEETGKPIHGGVSNDWQPLAKACSDEKALRPIVTKRGYVLAALVAKGVSSERLLSSDGVIPPRLSIDACDVFEVGDG
ncbi:hypothetical protein, partial [Methylobacterium frigidaeris]|uniref:hypothetical protein n=1 Tax=Methylobacterium frigidaeris TaxID=2038277 RepID=UPI001EDE9037